MKSSSLALLFYSFFLPSPLLNSQNSQNYQFEFLELFPFSPKLTPLLCFGVPFIVDMIWYPQARISSVCWVKPCHLIESKGVPQAKVSLVWKLQLKRVFGFSYKWKMSSWKVKGIGGIFNVMGDQDPLVPMSSTKPEDTTRPFHFSLPLDFNKIYNKSFLLSRIPMSGLFYLLARSRPSEDLLNCPYPSQDLLCFLSKDSLLG